MREVKYTVQPSMFLPGRFYAGVLKKNKRGLQEWSTRGDVTEDVIKCFLNMIKEKCIEDEKKSSKKDFKGMSYNYGFDGYDFNIEVKKKEDAISDTVGEQK